MKKKVFLAQVEAEAKRLRTRSRKSEREALDYDCLNPMYPTECIYGQMFGFYCNDRANELMETRHAKHQVHHLVYKVAFRKLR